MTADKDLGEVETRGDGAGNLKECSELLCSKKNKKRVFKEPENDEKIGDMTKKQFAPESKRKIRWAVNLYNEWRCHRLENPLCPLEIIQANLKVTDQFEKGDLAFSLARFVREVRKLDGNEYPPNTVREIVIMIQMYLHENSLNWKLLDEDKFLGLRNVVDNTMKERHALGMGVKKSSEIITLDNERQMFRCGALGEDSPVQLLKTVIYMIGLHCALRGGVEHNKLRRPNCNGQVVVETDKRGVECLMYREDPLQKTNQGGLECKNSNKEVFVYPADEVHKCPVRLYKKYIKLLPETVRCKKLYLRPRKNYNGRVWFCDQPYGVNKIKTTVKQLCAEAGITGKFTNHSLRATCASRMFASNVPEQIIKEVTGHKSDCVRTYKRTNENLREVASHTVSNSKPGTSMGGLRFMTDKPNVKEVKVETAKFVRSAEKSGEVGEVLSVTKMLENIQKTKSEIRRRHVSIARSRLSLKKGSKGGKVTIDLNLNINK